MSYQLLTGSNGIIHVDTGSFIPNDPGNLDWQAYQAWLALGNTPLAAVVLNL